MMDSPFFRSRYYHPLSSTTSSSSSSKIVSIPVHFVGSETTRFASALKIQKVFRGFLVRKCVKKIGSIKAQVNEIEQTIISMDELIRRDEKQRLRVNETLMALLFEMDSVRGVDFAVKDCRKAVIKKVIALQEKVDAMFVGTDHNAQTVIEDATSGTIQDCGNNQLTGLNCLDGAVDDIDDGTVLQCGKSEAENVDVDMPDQNCEKMAITEVGFHSDVEVNEEQCIVKEIVEDCNSVSECVQESLAHESERLFGCWRTK